MTIRDESTRKRTNYFSNGIKIYVNHFNYLFKIILMNFLARKYSCKENKIFKSGRLLHSKMKFEIESSELQSSLNHSIDILSGLDS